MEKDEIQPIGIAVLPEGKTKLYYIKNCFKLTDGSIGLIEETTSAYNETEEFIAEIYYFLPTKRTTKLDMDICEGLKIDKTENFVDNLKQKYPNIKFVNELTTFNWGQKMVRFYDLDGNLIEVRTPM